jgi:signal peptidase I
MFRRFRSSKASSKKTERVSLALTIVLILFLRAFVAEPFKIPSGSMIPTLLIGDHLFVAKSSYDMRIPFTNIPLLRVSDPKRGDVAVFEYPNHEQEEGKSGQYYIKRIIGLPGDRITVKGGQITLNDAPFARSSVPADPRPTDAPDFMPHPTESLLFKEIIPGQESSGGHWVQHYRGSLDRLSEARETFRLIKGRDCIEVGSAIRGGVPDSVLLNEVCEFTVPEGQYFLMGDNRDDSSDGRAWGFVERRLLRGRALFIWLPFKGFSFETDEEGGPLLRWRRFGLRIL